LKLPSKFCGPFFKVLWNFCQKPSNLLRKIICKFHSNYSKIPFFSKMQISRIR
jgi:hypothetical protein